MPSPESRNIWAAQHAVLGERHDLGREGAVVLGDGLAHDLDAAHPESEVDVDVGAQGRRAEAHELGEDAARDVEARDAELVTTGPLVADAAVRSAFAAVRLPRVADP